MSRALLIGFVGLALIGFGMVRADAAAPGMKVGYIDLQRTLNETKSGKSAKKRLEKEKSRKQAELDKEQKALKKMAADLERQKVVLKPAVLRQRERQLQEKYVKLQETYMKLQQSLAKQEALLVQNIFSKASPAIKAIAKERGFTMILEKNEGAVLWAAKSLDITDEVNKRLK